MKALDNMALCVVVLLGMAVFMGAVFLLLAMAQYASSQGWITDTGVYVALGVLAVLSAGWLFCRWRAGRLTFR